jgi:trehalose-6-phosphate synthase
LNEFAGVAAQQPNGALQAKPFNIEVGVDSIFQAYVIDKETRHKRMEKMRRSIKKNNIFHWVNAFLRAGIHKNLNQFQNAEFFIPKSASLVTRQHTPPLWLALKN